MCQIEQLGEADVAEPAQSEAYFPEGFAEQLQPDNCGVERPRLDDVEVEWYPGQWKAACELPLVQAAEANENSQFTFRFSFLPSFDSSVFIRLETHESGHRLVVKEMTGYGGYDAGIIARSKEVKLTEDEVQFFQTSLLDMRASRDASLERLAQEGPKDTCSFTFDGTRWIFETVENGRYDMFKTTSPTEGQLYELGTMLLKKSGWVDVETY